MALSTKETLKVLLPYWKNHKKSLFGIFILVILVVAADLVQPLVMKEAIDKHISVPNPEYGTLLMISVFYFFIVIVTFALTYYQSILLQLTGQKIIKHIRMDLFRHIQSLSLKYFDKNPSGRIITNVVSDTEALNSFFTDFLANNLRNLFTLIMIIVFMFNLNIKIASYCLIVVPLIVLISAYFQTKLRKVNQEMRSRLSTLVAFLAENLAGMSIVQIFNQEQKQYNDFKNRNTAYLQSAIKENRLSLLFFLFTETIGDFGVAGLIWFGSGPVIRGEVSFGVLFAFIC